MLHVPTPSTLFPYTTLFRSGQKAASGGIQGDVLATDNNTVGMGDAGIKSAIQGSNVPNPDEAVPSFVSGAMDGLIRVRNIDRKRRFSRNAETDLVCRLLLEKKNTQIFSTLRIAGCTAPTTT